MSAKSMFKYLTTVILILNTGLAWGDDSKSDRGSNLNDMEIAKNNQCATLRSQLRDAQKELSQACANAGFQDCESAIQSCSDAITSVRTKKNGRAQTSTIQQMTPILSSYLGVSPRLLNSATTANNKKVANKCPQFSGKSYLTQRERIDKKIQDIQDRIKDTNDTISKDMEKSNDKQEDLNEKIADWQEKIDDAEAELKEKLSDARNEQLDKQREAASSLNDMKKKMSDAVKKIKGLSTQLSTADSAYRRKQSVAYTSQEIKSACKMQANDQLPKLKEQFRAAQGSAAGNTKTLEATLVSSYRKCVQTLENDIASSKEEYLTKVQNLNDEMVAAQEEIKNLQAQITSSEGFDAQAQTNIETRTKELEGDRDSKVKRAQTAMSSAQQTFVQTLQSIQTSLQKNEQRLQDFEAQLVEAEAERTALMAMAPSTEEILATAETSKTPIEAARGISTHKATMDDLKAEMHSIGCSAPEAKKGSSGTQQRAKQ